MKLNLGCGLRKIHGFINVDIDPKVEPDVIDDVFNLREFDNNSIDLIYASHVLEHCPRTKIQTVLNSWYSLLKVEGILRLAVPDFGKVCQLYMTGHGGLQEWLGFIVGGQKNEFDVHRYVFDEYLLKSHLDKAGFVGIKRWDWKTTYPHNYVDDYSQAYMFPKGDKLHGKLCSLNMECYKID